MLENLANYKEFKRKERIEFIEYLRNQINELYADEKIKEEKLTEYTSGLVKELRRTSFIKLFADTLDQYMPPANELKHFNSTNVAEKFLNANGLVLEKRQEANELTVAMDTIVTANEMTADQSIKQETPAAGDMDA